MEITREQETAKVLTSKRFSHNFYSSDLILQNYVSLKISEKGLSYMADKYAWIGEQAAGPMNELSMEADRNEPRLITRNAYGEDKQEIRFHPSYWSLMDIALKSEMFYVKWNPALREEFKEERHRLGFVSGQIYGMSELGQYCPIAMTDGAARLIYRYADAADQERLLPKILTMKGQDLFTGAMFLTEKSGGSDVGKNQTLATLSEDGYYLLNGEKWFCSNVNAELTFVLARTEGAKPGTRGLSLFLVERMLEDGSRNDFFIPRIKEKLGVRSMATGEAIFRDTKARMFGEPGQGLKIMLDMVGLMRLYNAISAISSTRRAIVEAYQHLLNRTLFDKNGLEHPLIRDQFEEICSLYLADFYLTWRTVEALDLADNGDQQESQLFRILVPMIKYWTSQNAVYIARECMELMGGLGYIEDMVMPKLFRDVQVLPIWEGSSNVIVLDMLRALLKEPETIEILFSNIQQATDKHNESYPAFKEKALKLQSQLEMLRHMDRDSLESAAKQFFDRLIPLYQCSLMLDIRDEENSKWIDPALSFFTKKMKNDAGFQKPVSVELIHELMAWIPE